MKNSDFWGNLFIGFIIWLVILLIILSFVSEVYIYVHCWGLPLNNELPYECFNRWNYSVINH